MKGFRLWFDSRTKTVHWRKSPLKGETKATAEEAEEARVVYFNNITLDNLTLRLGFLNTDIALYDRVEQIVAESSDPDIHMAWNSLNSIPRGSKFIERLASLIPMTSDQMDQMFEKAASVNYESSISN